MRSVEPERLTAYVTDAKQRRLQSNVAVEDLTTQDRIQETNRFLDALRIQDRAPSVRVIGFSEFTFTQSIPLDNPQLADFAKHLGADYVVVACQYAGQANQTVMYPMTTFTNENATANVYGNNGYSAVRDSFQLRHIHNACSDASGTKCLCARRSLHPSLAA